MLEPVDVAVFSVLGLILLLFLSIGGYSVWLQRKAIKIAGPTVYTMDRAVDEAESSNSLMRRSLEQGEQIHSLNAEFKALQTETNELLRQNNALLRELLQDRQRERDEAYGRNKAA
jgi:hypothetical protein